jgi:hypothetical protein
MRLLIRAAAVLAGLALAAAIVASFMVDRIARSAVEKAGSAAVGSPVTLRSISIRPFAGAVSLAGLAVANPPGYSEGPILVLDRGGVEVQLATLLEEQVRLSSLSLDGIDVRIEQRIGGSNLKDLIANMPASPPSDPDAPPGKRFMIEQLTVRDIRVNAELLPVLGNATSIDFVIKEIAVADLDSDNAAGILLPQLTHEVVTAILAAVVEELTIKAPGNLVAGLGDGLKRLGVPELTMQVGEGVKKLGGDIASGAAEAIHGIGGALEQGVGGAVKGIGEGLDGVGKGIGELFGGDKKQ